MAWELKARQLFVVPKTKRAAPISFRRVSAIGLDVLVLLVVEPETRAEARHHATVTTLHGPMFALADTYPIAPSYLST